MKVLFLDIDGVLNSDETQERFDLFIGVDRRLLQRFLLWKPDNVFVVLSSAWRTHDRHCGHLNDLGVLWIDKTPRLWGVDRGVEISAWLGEHPEVTHYAILDDNYEMVEHRGHFVKTDEAVGLTEENLIEVSKILEL